MADRDDWVSVLPASAVQPGEIKGAKLPNGDTIAVYNIAGRFYATADSCTHEEASLSEEGLLDGGIVECGRHFGAFEVATGEPKAPPCTEVLKTYPVAVRDGQVCVRVSG